MTERPDVVTFKGNPVTLKGREIKIGKKAPDFSVVGTDLADIKKEHFEGKTLVLNVVPSLDTTVCALQTRRFNQEAANMGDVVILTVSMDLPFAQKRFAEAEGIDRVVMGSDYKYRDFGEKFGVYVKELGLLARSVFLVDKSGKIVYAQYVPEITTEPNYEAALEAIKAMA